MDKVPSYSNVSHVAQETSHAWFSWLQPNGVDFGLFWVIFQAFLRHIMEFQATKGMPCTQCEVLDVGKILEP